MSNQEIYDTVTSHLIHQGKAAYTDAGCRYRAPNGLKCAIGCLIKDEHYTSALETHGVSEIIVEEALAASGIVVTDKNRLLLATLQNIHDNVEPSFWPERLASVGEAYKLAPPLILFQIHGGLQ